MQHNPTFPAGTRFTPDLFGLTAWVVLIFFLFTPKAFAYLTYVETHKDDGSGGGVNGLAEARDIVVSPDNQHVYVAGYDDDAVAVFSRDTFTGKLTFVETHVDGSNGVDGIDGTTAVIVSPDGSHVYATGESDNAVAIFSRDTSTGALTFVGKKATGDTDTGGTLHGLDGASSVAVSPDNKHVYVTGASSNAVTAFLRDTDTGNLTFIETKTHGSGAVDGMAGPQSVFVSPDGGHIYVGSKTSGAVAVFSRNQGTGALTYIQYKSDYLTGCTSVVISPDNNYLYAAAPGLNKIALYKRDPANGTLSNGGYKEDGATEPGTSETINGISGTRSVAVSPDGRFVFASGPGDTAVAVFHRDENNGDLTWEAAKIEGSSDAGGTIDGLDTARAVAVSPDGLHVYTASGGTDDAVTVFGTGPVIRPPGYASGDYRLVFLSTGTTYGEESDISVYDTFVHNLAKAQTELKHLETTWKAIASTATVSAKTHTDTDTAAGTQYPIYRVDGNRIANDYSDLWDGNLATPLSVHENGVQWQSGDGNQYAYTGSNSNGTQAGSYTLGSANIKAGLVSATCPDWMHYSPIAYNTGARIYAISGVLPVIPSAPVIGTATAGDGQAKVSFSPPITNGGSAVTTYTATSSPGGITANGTASPIKIIGLDNGTAYTFTVTATNAKGTSAASAASGAVTPSQPVSSSTSSSTFYRDADGDGYGDPGSTISAASAPSGYVNNYSDCNDNAADIYPGAPEIPGDGIDQDCDGSDLVTWYKDGDQDGYGDPGSFVTADTQPSALYVQDGTDCNDSEAAIYPGAPETADDGIDQDCNGSDLLTWYKDGDQDGYGNPGSFVTADTQPSALYVQDGTDCNDLQAAIYPGATEISGDGIDQDCDGQDNIRWYQDADQDGFGDPANYLDAIDNPLGFVADHTDCDDTDDTIHPGADEIAGDNVDQDCDGKDKSLKFEGTLEAAPASGLAPVTVSFATVVAQGASPFTFVYNFGDGSPSAFGTAQTSHTFQAKGSYIVTVTVTDASDTVTLLTTTVEVVDTAVLEDLQSQLLVDSGQVEQAEQPEELPGILKDAQNAIEKSLKAVSAADPEVKQETQEAIRDQAGSLINNTKTKITGFIAADQTEPNDLDKTMSGLQSVVSSMVTNDVAVKDTTLTDLEAISGEVFSASAGSLLKDENLSPEQLDAITTNTAKAQEFFTANPHLLNGVVASSGIEIDVVTGFSAGQIQQEAKKQGLDDSQAAELIDAVEATSDVEKTIALGKDASKTIAEIAVEIVETFYGNKSLFQFSLEPITKNLLIQFTDDTYISFLISSVAIVDDFVPQGLFFMPDGSILGVKDSYSITLTPYPVFPFDFTAELLKLGNAPQLTGKGAVNITLSSNTKLSTGIGWQAFPGSTFNDLTTTFTVVGGSDPAAEAYSLLVSYNTGLSQLIPPAVLAMDTLLEMLNETVPNDYFIDTNTGVVRIGDVKLKPDYTFLTMNFINYPAIKANGGFVYNNKLAFEFDDYNGDGKQDFGLYSQKPRGFQVLFGLPD